MRKNIVTLLSALMIISSISFIGCAFMNKLFPGSINSSGQIVPGTHKATQTEQAAAGLLPYGIGSVILNGVLFAWNGYEKYKADKIGKGLSSTLLALNQVKNDADLKEQWERIKQILSDTHIAAGTQATINTFLAKL